jgi:Glycosyltransferase Family 4
MAEVPVDFVISTSPPLATHVAALWLNLRHGVRWVADFRDPLAASPLRTALRNRVSDYILQRLIFRHAAAAVAVTDVMARQWRERSSVSLDKCHVIWNGFDPAEPFPAPRGARRPYKVLAHVGDCYGARHPGKLLESLERLMNRGLLSKPSVQVDLIGPLDMDSPVRALPAFAALLSAGCLQFNAEAVPRGSALQAIADADYLLILDLHDPKNGYAAPSKLFDYVRAGRPILAFTSRNSTVATFLKECGVPYACVYPDDTEAETDQNVLSFLSQPAVPIRAGDWFWHNFDGRRQVEALASILIDLSIADDIST